MDLNTVYRKTQKGQEEIAQRTVLGMRERTLLVMVDGKATVAQLLARAQHMPDPPALLAKLIDGGFIAADAAAAPNPAAASASSQAPAQAQAAPPEQQVMQQTMRYAERFLDQVLGPQSEALAEAIAKCKTLPELRTRLEKTRDVIEGMGKKRRAEEFWAVQALLEGRQPAAPGQASPAAPAAAPAAPPAAAPSPPPPSAPAPPPSIPEAVRFARRFLNDALGPDADALVEPIERCKTLPELRAAMEKTRDALAASGSRRKAEEFWKGVELRLPAA
jgi:hypothetical protein